MREPKLNTMQMTEAQRRERLIKWLEQIYRDVQQLLINDHLFWELQEIVRSNDELTFDGESSW